MNTAYKLCLQKLGTYYEKNKIQNNVPLMYVLNFLIKLCDLKIYNQYTSYNV
jgi:hypothetical protein